MIAGWLVLGGGQRGEERKDTIAFLSEIKVLVCVFLQTPTPTTNPRHQERRKPKKEKGRARVTLMRSPFLSCKNLLADGQQALGRGDRGARAKGQREGPAPVRRERV